MIIIGAGGFAKELLEIFHQKGMIDELAFYDDTSSKPAATVFGRFPVLRTEDQVKNHFISNGNSFTIGIGNPVLRFNLCQKFESWGGILTSVFSPKANLGSYEVTIGKGTCVLDGAVFSNCTETGIGCIVYYNAIITHDCKLGNYVQVSPGVAILGTVVIEDFVMIGANATILPRLIIGKHAMIAAAALISKPVPAYALMVGNPARQIGWVSEFGDKLSFDSKGIAFCGRTGKRYQLENNQINVWNEP